MKRVLYIAYYWPPCGGISVLRNSKFVKYFADCGWSPVVFAPENPHYPMIDEESLLDIPHGTEIIKKAVTEPFGLFNVLKGKKAGDKVQDVFLVRDKEPGIVHKAGVWVRGNFFIPDARMLWINPSIAFLESYLKKNPVDAILSSGPPHSSHRIAYGLKLKTGLPWIADFQDPWTQIDYFEKFMLTNFARKLHFKQEREVLQSADAVTTVSWEWAKDFEKLSGRKAETITMGFDDQDFKDVAPLPTSKFIISHFGTLGLDRNPHLLWKLLAEIGNEHKDFLEDLEIQLAGVVDYTVFEDIEEYGLKAQLKYFSFLQRKEVIARMKSSAIQLLLLNKGFGNYNVKGRIPAKIFEYLGSHQPILALGESHGDVAHIIAETQSGLCIDYEEESKLKSAIVDFYTAWKEGTQKYKPVNIEQFTFRKLACDMIEILRRISQIK